MVDIFDRLKGNAEPKKISKEIPVSSKEDIFTKLSQRKGKNIPEAAKIAADVPAQFLSGAAGSIPQLTAIAGAIQPRVKELEEQSTPEFLPSSDIEGPNRGLTNLLALLSKVKVGERELGEFTPEELHRIFEEKTEGRFSPQSDIGKALGRGASLAGQALPFGATPSALAGIGAGGVVGETLRQSGFPEGIATTAEIITPGISAALGRKIPFTPQEQQLVNTATRSGLNDREIAALLKSPRAQANLGKLSSKGPKSQRYIENIFNGLGDNYAALKEAGRATGEIPHEITSKLNNKFRNVLHDLRQTHAPSADKSGAIKYVQDVIEDINNFGTNPEKLINLYQDINRTVNWNAFTGGKKQLAALKNPIKKAIEEAVPGISQEFENTNELYQRSIKLAKHLKPSQIENLLLEGNLGELALAIGTLNPGLLNKIGGILGVRALNREILFNPRFNKIAEKMRSAIKKNDKVLIRRLSKEFQDTLNQENEK